MATGRDKVKKGVFYILMLGLTIFFCFIVLEYVFGRFYYSDVNSISTVSIDPLLGWRLKPGTYLLKAPNTFKKHKIHINKYGLRYREISEAREGETIRIVVLGDSFVFGKAIGDKDIFTTRLENILNRDAGDKKYQILNAGVPGYGTGQQLMLMRELAGKKIIGDYYLLAFFTNDILDNLRRFYATLDENTAQPGYVLDNSGEIALKYLPVVNTPETPGEPRDRKRPLERTRIFDTLKLRMEAFLQTKPAIIRTLGKIGVNVKFPWMPGLLNAWYRDDVLETGIPLTKAITKEIKNEAISNNSRLLACFIPSQIQVYSETYGALLKKTFPDSKQVDDWLTDIERPQRITGSICEELDIPYLDLYPVLVENNEKTLYIPREGHFNENGHAVVAKTIADFILDYTE